VSNIDHRFQGAVRQDSVMPLANRQSVEEERPRYTFAELVEIRRHGSIEQLAEANSLHPKVVRQNLRLAFLAPDVTSLILEEVHPAGLSLARIPKLLPLPWAQHRRLLD
jgi:hypothetical protein